MELQLPDETLDAAFARIGVLPDEYYNRIPAEVRNIAFTVTQIESINEINQVLRSLNSALEDGLTFSEWQDTVDIPAFSALTEARQQLVFRTHVNTAFNQGKLDFGRANPDLVPYFRYDAILDGVVRPEHAALNGITRPVNDAFWDTYTPPIDFNCRCVLVSLSREEAALGGSRSGVNDEAATGDGLTPPSVVDSITENVRPGPAFRNDRSRPLRGISAQFRRSVDTLPPVLQNRFNDAIETRPLMTQVWLDRNRDALARPEDEN